MHYQGEREGSSRVENRWESQSNSQGISEDPWIYQHSPFTLLVLLSASFLDSVHLGRGMRNSCLLRISESPFIVAFPELGKVDVARWTVGAGGTNKSNNKGGEKMNKTKTARQCCSTTTPKTSTHTDKPIITDFDRATRYAAYAICGMFAFMIAWMWLAW